MALGQSHLFQPTCVGQELNFCISTGEIGLEAPISEYHLTPFCSEDLLTAEDLQLGTYSAQPPAMLS